MLWVVTEAAVILTLWVVTEAAVLLTLSVVVGAAVILPVLGCHRRCVTVREKMQ